jgi:ssDNA-binding Zn-finger/Zn-ribbon topoisomerase 1
MAEHIVKTCPRCGWKLVIRRNRETGEEFLSCLGWRVNQCTYTEPLPEAIKLRRAGQRSMFDEEAADG